ncbi:hypothetical protein LTS18_005342, partial [Coniosporium uncinatum]
VKDGKPQLSRNSSEQGEGLGGWISGMVKRGTGNGEGDGASGQYKRVPGQDED